MHCHCSNIFQAVGQRSNRHPHCSCFLFVHHFWFCLNQRSLWLTLSAWAKVALDASDFLAVNRLWLLCLLKYEGWECCQALTNHEIKWLTSVSYFTIPIVWAREWSCYLNLPDGNLTGTPMFNWFIRSNAIRCRSFLSTSLNSCKCVFFKCKYFPVDDFQMQFP